MAEDLTTTDVQNYTNGRLQATDPNVQILLDTALARARRFCGGWHVSPVKDVTLTFRGSGDHQLALPTLNIVSVVSITEVQWDSGGGTPPTAVLDPTTYVVYPDDASAIHRRFERFHREYDYTVEFTHGYAAIDAMDFRQAVLQYIDLSTQMVGQPGSGPVSQFQVDDVITQWEVDRASDSIASNPLVASALYQYRILPIA